jgi:hypothetical protein
VDPGYRERLLNALEAAGVAAEVVITRNRTTMLSVRAKYALRGTRLLDREVRIAERFAALGDVTIDAIVAFATDAAGARERVNALIRMVPPDAPEAAAASHPGTAPLRIRSRRDPPIRSRGLHHDLAAIAEAERRVYFPELPALPVAWGRREPRGRRRQLSSIRLGSYEPQDQLVRIHPRLDDPRVPAWFIGFVIFHEYLHYALGIKMSGRGDRRELHPPAFREAETRHQRYQEALAWEEAHIKALLSPGW